MIADKQKNAGGVVSGRPRGMPVRSREPVTLESLYASETGDILADAFPGKQAMHGMAGAVPVPPQRTDALWKELMERPRSGPGVAYVHIPFCENHCLFCGFYQHAWRGDLGGSYVDTILEQLRGHQDSPAHASHPLRAVYLGGGTPTALSSRDIARLVEGLRAALPLAPDCEITLEGRILSFGAEKARAAFDAGVNRISIGVQTFDEPIRKRLGRKSTRAETLRFLNTLVALDRGAVVIDLIHGLPGQTPQGFAEDAALAARLGLDGVDLYSLSLIPGTPLLLAQEKGKLMTAPMRELGTYYAAGAEALDRAGWEAISCTHWRGGTRERNIYNFEVKSGADCIALGAGAGGFLHGHAYRIPPDLSQYDEVARQGGCLAAGFLAPSPLAAVHDAIKAGMERARLDTARVVAALRAATGDDFAAIAGPLLAQWTRAGLMRPRHDFLDLTLAGRFWQTAMTGRLMDWITQECSPKPTGDTAT
ncbi:heme anaerobic degradation radical SAM methyltransferase ChuW/HutW [Tropicimonas sp.]|uniref:heme anaerobic degradation radical SAM methyltransferase ChuW/HutW n=1 Tax=Tropicimonas sp. TaxID=2067044 RepID=UPI003A87CE3F